MALKFNKEKKIGQELSKILFNMAKTGKRNIDQIIVSMLQSVYKRKIDITDLAILIEASEVLQ